MESYETYISRELKKDPSAYLITPESDGNPAFYYPSAYIYRLYIPGDNPHHLYLGKQNCYYMRRNRFKVDVHFNSSVFNSFDTIPMIRIHDNTAEGQYKMKFTYSQMGGGLASPYEIEGEEQYE